MDFDEPLSTTHLKTSYVPYNKLPCLCHLYLFVKRPNPAFPMENSHLFSLNDKAKLSKLDLKSLYSPLNKRIPRTLLEKIFRMDAC